MGQIHSQVAPGAPFNVNPRRLNIREFQCFLNAGDQTTTEQNVNPVSAVPIVTAIPDSSLPGTCLEASHPPPLTGSPTTANLNGQLRDSADAASSCSIPTPQAAPSLVGNRGISVTTQDKRPLTFVLDPETNEMLLQLPYQPSYTFRFSLTMFLSPGTAFTRLYFAHAGSAAELEPIISNHQTELWTEVRQWAQPAYPRTHQLDFLFVWDAQGDRVGGQPVHFAFFVDDRTETVLTPRMGAAIWVSERPSDFFEDLPSPASPSQTSNVSQALAARLPTAPAESSHMHALNQPNALPAYSPGAGAANSITQNGQVAYNPVMNPLSSPGGVPYGVPLAQFAPSSQAPRPDSSHFFEPEDGPQFRSAIASMERRVPHLKIRIKQLLKRSLMSRARMQALIEADNWLASAIQEASRQDCISLRPIADWFSRTSEGGFSAIQRQRKVCLNELTTRLIEPLQRYYEYDIKCFEQRKREFEEESSQFYSWTSRYLSARKEARRSRTGESSDAKFAVKKRSFDVARFDYFSYLNDLTTGLKQQVLLQLAALAAQSMTDSHIALGSELANRTQQEVDDIVEDIKGAAKEWEKYRVKKQQYRKLLVDDDAAVAPQQQSLSQSQQLQKDGDRQASPELQGGTGIYKEGLLWASNRPGGVQDSQGPNKQTLQTNKWHKYWVVLDGSSLREFSNWKQNADLHNEPINLLVACVREARNTERRFCFEVVTPQYKRVYQATSEDDMRLWINAIHQSISTMLENTDDQLLANSPPRETDSEHLHRFSNSVIAANNLPATNPNHILSTTLSTHSSESGSPRINNGIDALTRKLSLKSEKPRVPPIVTSVPHHNSIQSSSAHLQKTALQTPMYVPSMETVQSNSSRGHSARQELGRNIDFPGPSFTPMKGSPFDELLFQIHTKPSNRCCAECRTTRSVEWVSINLLAVLCIECSGAHRSLGAHISKVRSLTLDIGAFTPSLRGALLAVSNDQINQIWEAKLPPARKLSPDATSQARVKFVSEKYVEKQYIREVEKPNAALRRAISEQNVHGVCAALASRANPNGVSDADEPMLILALRSAEPTDSTFPTAEVLMKNGAAVPTTAFEGLSENAQAFLSARQVQT